MTAHFVEQLDDLRRRIHRMASLVEDIVQEACEAVAEVNSDLARRVIGRDRDVDSEEVRIEAEVIRLLALYQPVGSDLRLLCAILKINNDLERVADCAVNIAERVHHLDQNLASEYTSRLKEISEVVRRMLRHAVQAFQAEDMDISRTCFQEDDIVDALYENIIKDIVARSKESMESVAGWLDILSIAKNLERIADHATNIAEDVVFLSTGKIVRHSGEDIDSSADSAARDL